MNGAARLQVALLGTFRVSRGGIEVAVPGARLRGLLVRLALAGGRAVDPGSLIDAIWAEDPPAGASHALQSLVSRLRHSLGAAGDVEQVAGGYRLAVEAADVDALQFERLADTGRARLRSGEPGAAAELLGDAVVIWAERAGTEPVVVAAVAPAAAIRLATASVEAVTDLAEAELALGQADEAATRLAALLAENPVHERATGLLMDALTALGRQGEALGLFERVRAAMSDQLGADPGAALRERHLRLLRATPEAAPPADTAVTTPPTNTLPAPVTSFVGRDDDLARIETLLAAGRLVTVLGPGGAGKSRTAVEAARRAPRGDVWLVDLAPVTDPGGVAAAVLAATGARGDARRHGEEIIRRSLLDVLADRFGGRGGLLLLDNCEHLIDAVAHLTVAMLSRCAGLRVLATSREPLAVDGEALVPLDPLALPGTGDDVGQAARAASVRLFVQRAAAVRPGFELNEATLPDVVRVVRRLDGLPLALELAAARLRTLSLPELADGLSDRFRLLTTGSRTALPRHRTLRAVIAWSWQLLGEHERTLADRVAVLPGGVTATSAAALCAGTPVPVSGVPELLAHLVDRSLLQLAPEPGRYRMLETLREYGTERLREAGELAAVRELAAEHIAELVATHDAALRGPAQRAALRVIKAEYGNALVALRHRCDAGAADPAVALALNLTWYWQMLGRRADAAHWLGEALAVPGGEPTPERDCARAIHLFNRIDTGTEAADGLATAHARTRELADRLHGYPVLPSPHGVLAAGALAFLGHERAARPIIDRLACGDDAWFAGLAHLFRAELAENSGRLDTVRADVLAALACFRRAGDRWGQASVLPLRAQLRQYDGELDDALTDLSEANALAGEFGAGDLTHDVFTGMRRIELHLRRGDTDRAHALLASVREQALRTDRPEMLALLNAREADFRMQLGERGRARELLDRAEADTHGNIPYFDDHVRAMIGSTRARLHLGEGDRDAAAAALRQAYAAALHAQDLPILALVAVGAAALAEALGHHQRSATLLGAAARLRGAHDPTDLHVRDVTRRGQHALGGDAFTAAYTEGWHQDSNTAATTVDPAHLTTEPGPTARKTVHPR